MSDTTVAPQDQSLFETGYEKALDLMRQCLTENGFLASTMKKDNYQRIWARDSCFMGLVGTLTGDDDLVDGCRRTVETLKRYQGPHGEIPSNVDPKTERVSYGGTAGRVDADLWYMLACGGYFRLTEDQAFVEDVLESLSKVRFLLGAWEFNNRGFLYVPLTGDWADEYLHNGYVLFDQLLYLQAQRELCWIHRKVYGSEDHDMRDRVSRLKQRIQANYWIEDRENVPEDAYHDVLYKKGMTAKNKRPYWLPFFTPAGYGYRFDALANVLASLFGLSDEHQEQCVDEYIADEFEREDTLLLPAFHPVITPDDKDWDRLHMTFSYSFKNKPYEFQNGGLWPFITGFYVADLASRGKTDKARRYLGGIHQANAKEMEGEAWGFPEYLHGKTFKPEGTRCLGWSAAAAVMGQLALEGKFLIPHSGE